MEGYFCSYGLNSDYHDALNACGVSFTGHDDDGNPRLFELAGHPFFIASLFQPELSALDGRAHPLVQAFLAAALTAATPPLPA